MTTPDRRAASAASVVSSEFIAEAGNDGCGAHHDARSKAGECRDARGCPNQQSWRPRMVIPCAVVGKHGPRLASARLVEEAERDPLASFGFTAITASWQRRYFHRRLSC